MADVNGRMTMQVPVFTCPACAVEVSGTVAMRVELGEPLGREVPAKVRMVGLDITHNCMPKITRGGAG